MDVFLFKFSLIVDNRKQSEIKSWPHLVFLVELVQNDKSLFFFFITLVISHKDLSNLRADNREKADSQELVKYANKPFISVIAGYVSIADCGNSCHCVVEGSAVYLIVCVTAETPVHYPVVE